LFSQKKKTEGTCGAALLSAAPPAGEKASSNSRNSRKRIFFVVEFHTHTHITQSGQCEWLFTHLHRLCCCVAGVVVAYVMMPQFLYLKTQKGLREYVFCVVTLRVLQKMSLSLVAKISLFCAHDSQCSCTKWSGYLSMR